MIPRSLFLSIALPAVIAGSVLLWAGWPKRRDAGAVVAAGAGALALGAAFFAAYTVLVGWPPFPPVEATQRLAYIALIAGTVLALLAWRPNHAVVTGVVRAIVSLALPWLLLRANIEYRWSALESVLWVAGLGTATFLYGIALDAAARRNEGVVAPFAWFIAWTGHAIVALLSGSALLAQLAGACAAALGAACVVGLLQPRLALAPGGSAVLAWLWVGLSINAVFYAEGSGYALVLSMLAGLGALATRRLAPDSGTVARVLAAAWPTTLVAIAAVVVAWRG